MKIHDVNFAGFDCTLTYVSDSTIIVSNPTQDFWVYLRRADAEIARGAEFFNTPGRHFEAALPTGRRVSIRDGKLSLTGRKDGILSKVAAKASSVLVDMLTSQSKKQ